MNIHLAQALPHHARLIAANMRARDVAELKAGWNQEPLEAMNEALKLAYYARVMMLGLEPLCLFGLLPLTVAGAYARFFIFSTSAIDRHPIAFARASRRCLPEIFCNCRLATNLVDVNDAPVMKWLKWLGCSFVDGSFHRGGREFVQAMRSEEELRVECQQA